VFMFDEPTSYLDVKQRLTVSNSIRDITNQNNGANYVIVVEHDLSILDYMSDAVCCLYGKASAYGVITMPMNVREGINAFLAGFIETDNVRFRDNELKFNV
jgi:ATP-binding cassette, sub-family E, member 1